MKRTISLGQFRSEIATAKNLRLVSDDPLLPTSIDMKVDHVAVILSASSYVCLKNDSCSICLSHISSIKQVVTSDERSYIFRCGDYASSNTPAMTDFKLYVTGE